MSTADIKKNAEAKMAKSIDALKGELQKIRTGRAHPGLLDQVSVDYYGSMVPISQVANVTLLDARTISVQPWEKGMGAKIEKAIRESDLGLNPASQGDLIRVPMPPLTEERRRDLTKVVRNAGEDAKVAVRNLRRDANEQAKKLLKDCTAAGLTLREVTAPEMQARADELHGLYGQVHQAQGLRLATLTPGYLPALAEALGPRFRCRVAEHADGRWLGFVTSVHDGDTTLGYYIGYDRAANADAPIYLTLLQSTVQDAIAFGSSRLSLGRTALEPKAKLGAKPEPLSCAVRHRVSALNWITTALTRTAEHDEPPERSPFKAAPVDAA